MGMDGLSFANTGAIKEQTSAELANKVEHAISSDPKNFTQQVQETSVNQRVKEKEDGDGGNAKREGNPKKDEEFEDGLVQTPKEAPEDFHVEDLENPNKEFYVKLNIKDDIIELYDRTTNRLVETISGTELEELVHKLNMASGIFVNKKV